VGDGIQNLTLSPEELRRKRHDEIMDRLERYLDKVDPKPYRHGDWIIDGYNNIYSPQSKDVDRGPVEPGFNKPGRIGQDFDGA